MCFKMNSLTYGIACYSVHILSMHTNELLHYEFSSISLKQDQFKTSTSTVRIMKL